MIISKNTIKNLDFQYILNMIEPYSPYGIKKKKKMRTFILGEEGQLIEELNKIEFFLKHKKRDEMKNILAHFKEIGESIEKSKKGYILLTVELFEIKNFLIQVNKLIEAVNADLNPEKIKFNFEDIKLRRLVELEKSLDPKEDRLNTFYIYDEYSKKLINLRNRKRKLKREMKEEKEKIKEKIKKEYDLNLNLKDEVVISKAEKNLIEKIESGEYLTFSSENYLNHIYSLRKTEKILLLESKYDEMKSLEDKEEKRIRKNLSKLVSESYDSLKWNIETVGNIDLVLAKSEEAKQTESTKPKVVTENILKIKNGRHLKTEKFLHEKGNEYTPITVDLLPGTTCITGANMGGKTVTLKMVGQVMAVLTFGLYVPCERLEAGLRNFIYISTGDEQSVERGLSTFGAEIFSLKEVLEREEGRGLILIDELAGGTNPKEGYAITKTIIEYLNEKDSISIITTHFDKSAEGEDILKLQVSGLSYIDEDQLKDELKLNPKKGQEIIAKYMDYTLRKVEGNEVPKDAIRIAQLMGLQEDIINKAKEIIKESK
ncbi:MAG: DNA mismatch repair protein MutS [Bacillota bacterium]|nr:DNA mismatch repair protein MutS [Bacillota bacterium]